jgi:tripartite-type tricarboxylate transporter receptor subunit TctC
MNRRHVLRSLTSTVATATLGLTVATLRAQANGPLTIVVPYAAGGGTDALARLIGNHLASELGRPVAVENRPGAGSTLGAAHVARAAADGHTLLMATSSTLAIAPVLYPKLGYQPLTDFAPIGMIAAVPFVLVVPPSLEVRDVAALLSLARRSPGGLAYGSAGNGSPQHLAAELFRASTGIELRHIPYAGSAAAITDLLGGRFELMFADLAPALPHIRARRLRALGVTSAARLPNLPEVLPLAQAGIAELAPFEVSAWQSLVAPAGVSVQAVEQLSRALGRVMQQPSMREQLENIGMQPRWEPAEQLAVTMRAEARRWAGIVKTARITVD